MDLGGALAYWAEANDDELFRLSSRQPSDLPGMPTRQQIVSRYAELTGISLGDWTYYEVFGLFRLAVIAQQIYYRYYHEQTTNPAFKGYWILVSYLEQRCATRAGLS